MTPKERAAAAMKDAQGGPIVAVSPERTEAIIARHIEEAVADSVTERWIHVDASPPPSGRFVLVYSEAYGTYAVAARDPGSRPATFNRGDFDPLDGAHEPTHWRELPEPPR